MTEPSACLSSNSHGQLAGLITLGPTAESGVRTREKEGAGLSEPGVTVSRPPAQALRNTAFRRTRRCYGKALVVNPVVALWMEQNTVTVQRPWNRPWYGDRNDVSANP